MVNNKNYCTDSPDHKHLYIWDDYECDLYCQYCYQYNDYSQSEEEEDVKSERK